MMNLHVVPVNPEIHWNTGNACRSCLAAGATLHLIEPLGFSLDEREVRRAGLDYWEHVDLRIWPSWDAFGRETGGLPAAIHERYAERMLSMPIHSEHVRSLNLSTCVGIALYEVLRQNARLSS